jgi:hypothetical protein
VVDAECKPHPLDAPVRSLGVSALGAKAHGAGDGPRTDNHRSALCVVKKPPEDPITAPQETVTPGGWKPIRANGPNVKLRNGHWNVDPRAKTPNGKDAG